LKDSNTNGNVKQVNLTECFKMFESPEEIHSRDGLICEECKVPTNHMKKMGLSKAPPILIVHLKRFKIINK